MQYMNTKCPREHLFFSISDVFLHMVGECHGLKTTQTFKALIHIQRGFLKNIHS